ncbi:MAG TPA: Holliday junction branch migration DNA helicase RuvB [Candidatus Dojkabacteria bacterium]
MVNDRIQDTKIKQEDEIVEKSLRPKTIQEVIGCVKEKRALKVMIDAAKGRGDALDHILFHGPPGLGKTSLSHVVANEMNVPIYATSGPAIERQGDLAAILTNIEEKGILFIDEIHRLNKSIEEILYPAMEDGVIDIVIGKGPSAKTLRLDLNKFTVIGATTRMSLISSPLRSRFGMDIRMDYYSYKDLADLIKRKAGILDVAIDDEAAAFIAERSRRTPRLAERLLKRVRDYADIHADSVISINEAKKGAEIMEIDSLGLDVTDRKLLLSIINNFKGGPVGLSTLAASIDEELGSVEEVYEPYLLRENLIVRTSRGRMATEKAFRHLGIEL